MHDNFEKEVQRKMDEMRLTPSAPVWQKIEMQIKPEERKRRLIFWFLLAGLLLAGGGWWTFQSVSEMDSVATTNTTTKPPKKVPSDTVVTVVKTSKLTGTTSKALSWHPIHTRLPKLRLKKGSFIKPPDLKTKEEEEEVAEEPILIATHKINLLKTIISAAEKEITFIDKVRDTQQLYIKNAAVKKQTWSIDTSEQTIAKHDGTVKDSMNKPGVKSSEALLLANDSSVKRKTAAAKKGWKKLINVSAGRVDYNEGEVSGLYSAANLSQYSLTTSSVTGSSHSQKTSAGLGFAIGFAAAKQVGKKWELSIGLQYTYYSTHTKVGERKLGDTIINYVMDKVAVSAFYTNARKNDYTNRFHVVELPVNVSYRPSLKMPLFLAVGAAYGRVLSTNALTYSPASNLYYQNKANYARSMLPVSASLQYALGSNNAASIRIGPFAQYNLLKLRKENTSGTPHMTLLGIKAAIKF